jgi:hypothetical protein
MRRVLVYALASFPDSEVPARQQLQSSVDLIADTIAGAARGLLRAAPGTVGAGEPEVTWRSLGGAVLVMAHRDGQFTARAAPDSAIGDEEADRRGRDLLLRAVAAVRASGETFIWDASVSGDSTEFALTLDHPEFSQDGTVRPLKARASFPTFTVDLPWLADVRYRHASVPRYPEPARKGMAEATVKLRFVVDTAGRAVSESIGDLPSKERDFGGGGFYLQFLAASVAAIKKSQFVPAIRGGCPVRQMVQEALHFRLSDGHVPREPL